MDDTMQNKIQELMSNEEYVKHLASLGSVEEISKELAKEDIDLSPDDLRKMGKLLKKKESGELTDEELEEVAGGFVWWFVMVGVLAAATAAKGVYHVVKVNVCD